MNAETKSLVWTVRIDAELLTRADKLLCKYGTVCSTVGQVVNCALEILAEPEEEVTQSEAQKHLMMRFPRLSRKRKGRLWATEAKKALGVGLTGRNAQNVEHSEMVGAGRFRMPKKELEQMIAEVKEEAKRKEKESADESAEESEN